MIILRIACDNLYMFKNFEVDFTYNRQINHALTKNDRLFEGSKIKVRKNLIIMGANASGKTTFGRLLCMILNFINAKTFGEGNFKPETVRYDKTRNASFEIEFAVGKTAYLLEAILGDNTLLHETLTVQKICKAYNINTLREKLKEKEPVSVYDAAKSRIKIGLRSYAFSATEIQETEAVKKNISFWFRFSEDSTNTKDYEENISVEILNSNLPKIDNSIDSVERLYSEKNLPTDTYRIKFKNGDLLTVPNGDLRRCYKRLSHGTFEAIDFILMLDALKSGRLSTFYIDEFLAHTNPELEAYFIRNAFISKSEESQVFFTTHNIQILALNAPANTFMFFRRNAAGFNEIIYPADKISKNDRNLKGYYDNDYFGILPDYSALDTLFNKGDADE